MNDIQEKCKKMLKHELKASEIMEDMIVNQTHDEVETAFKKEFSRLNNKVEDKNRRVKLYRIAMMVGQSIDSEELQMWGASNLEEFSNA